MSPRQLTPREVALYSAFTIAGIAAGIVLVSLYLSGNKPMWYAAIAFVLVFLISFLVVQYGLRRFIQHRIDQLHRVVHDVQTTATAVAELEMGEDVLGKVSDDVLGWADEKREEIKELKERESYRREFIGNLAHELKTPITTIQGYILTLLEGGLEDDNVNRDFLERASRGVDRLTNIVEDMDTITRLEEGVLDLKIDRVDLHTLVDDSLKEMRILAKAGGVKLLNDVPPYTLVNCDLSRIGQVFTNLLNNSIKYGKEGGKVTISSYPVNDRIVIEVSDDGIGIEGEHLPRLFERFYRVGSSRSRHEGGSGLGLAIVKHIVEAHGHAITVVSEIDQGTRFTFSLSKE